MSTRLYANEYEEGHKNPEILIVTDNPDQFTKAHHTDGGYDIVSDEDVVIRPGFKELISTGLYVAIPRGYVGIIKSRSGLSARHDLETGAGVIDYGYTGEIKVVLRNHSAIPYIVKSGDKIAQMVIVPICTMSVKLVEDFEASARGERGFGSSGY